MNMPTLDYLKRNHKLIHFFGLGFIQIKMTDKERYHFYSEELPAFVDQPHNHRYNFTSICLKGGLQHTFYEVIIGRSYNCSSENYEHKLVYESCSTKVNSIPSIDCHLRCLQGFNPQVQNKGDTFFINHNDFHTIKPTKLPTITHITRDVITKDFAQVIVPTNEEKICPFSKKIPEKDLWRIVEKCLKA